MLGKRVFYINGKPKSLPLFEKGDRVEPLESQALAIGAVGTVDSTDNNGLFVNIDWDNKVYPCKCGGNVELGKMWMADGLKLITN